MDETWSSKNARENWYKQQREKDHVEIYNLAMKNIELEKQNERLRNDARDALNVAKQNKIDIRPEIDIDALSKKVAEEIMGKISVIIRVED